MKKMNFRQRAEAKWGLGNYIELFQDKEGYTTRFNSVRYTLVYLAATIAISLVLAVPLNRKTKGRGAYRTIYFLPMVCAPAAVAMVWRWLYNQNYALINHIFGIDIAWISVVIIGIWSSIGYNMILFLGETGTLLRRRCGGGASGRCGASLAYAGHPCGESRAHRPLSRTRWAAPPMPSLEPPSPRALICPEPKDMQKQRSLPKRGALLL